MQSTELLAALPYSHFFLTGSMVRGPFIPPLLKVRSEDSGMLLITYITYAHEDSTGLPPTAFMQHTSVQSTAHQRVILDII